MSIATDQPHRHLFFMADTHMAERRTLWVIALNVVGMVGEITGGYAFGSISLIADGWHMGADVVAFLFNFLAFFYARRWVDDSSFTFGTWKIQVIGGLFSALILLLSGAYLAVESLLRLQQPQVIEYQMALWIALLGLAINLISMALLRQRHGDGHSHGVNQRSAYLHALFDAANSLAVLLALGLGLAFGWAWADGVSALAVSLLMVSAAVMVIRRAINLLLDRSIAEEKTTHIRQLLEAQPTVRVSDLHVWQVGENQFAGIVSLVTPSREPPKHYKQLLSQLPELVHITVEIHPEP